MSQLLSLLSILSFLSHTTPLIKSSSEVTTPTEVTASDDPHNIWLKWYNSAETDLSGVYLEDAVMVDGQGAYHTASLDKVKYISQLRKEIGHIEEITSEYITKVNDNISYEIALIKTKRGERYYQLIIWRSQGQQLIKELELIERSEAAPGLLEEIEYARAEWIRLCNLHNPIGLVQHSYTADALYYNHKPLVIGTVDIAQEYGYMSNEGYTLHLSPLHITTVHSNIVFEIGQCSGSYNGKYMLVWQKDDQGSWKVLLDSNF